jgi:hypothetical protein
MGRGRHRLELFVNNISSMSTDDPVWIDIYKNGSCKSGRGFKEGYNYYISVDHMLKELDIDLKDYDPIPTA